MQPLTIRVATLQDVEKTAQLQAMEKNMPWESLTPTFEAEFSICAAQPKVRIYLLAFSGEELVSYAGARSYNQSIDENMYGTSELLPSGWYLRGIKVHPKWRRKGLAREMTLRRLDWLFQRTNHVYVFLDDENKVSLPMYLDLGFNEVSRGWIFSEPQRIAKGKKGLLLDLYN
jgi:RimJ/RimL family protein N-acetyltransferase